MKEARHNITCCMYGSIYVKCPEQVHSSQEKDDQWSAEAGAGGNRECLMGLGFPTEGDENVLGLNRMEGCTMF